MRHKGPEGPLKSAAIPEADNPQTIPRSTTADYCSRNWWNLGAESLKSTWERERQTKLFY